MDSQSFLDEMIEEDSVQILKAALPYLPASGQSFVSIFAKILELQNTIRLFAGSNDRVQLCAQSQEKTNPLEMLTACSNAVSYTHLDVYKRQEDCTIIAPMAVIEYCKAMGSPTLSCIFARYVSGLKSSFSNFKSGTFFQI